MLFNPSNLPDGKWLSLDDVVHFYAFGEPYVNGIREAGYPCDRECVAEINEAAQRCLAEAGSDPKHSALVELLNKPGLWKADAVAPLLFECKPVWPASGQRLYELFAQYDRTQADEVVKLEAATDQVEACLMSEKVVFEGDRGGRRERIDAAHIYGVTVVWQNKTVSAHPMIPQCGAKLLVWQEVVIERASLARWLEDMEFTAHGQAAPARATIEKSSAPSNRGKRRGRSTRATAESEAAARAIVAEKKASRDPSDKTDLAVIRAFQAWWKKHEGEPAPVDESVRRWLTRWGL